MSTALASSTAMKVASRSGTNPLTRTSGTPSRRSRWYRSGGAVVSACMPDTTTRPAIERPSMSSTHSSSLTPGVNCEPTIGVYPCCTSSVCMRWTKAGKTGLSSSGTTRPTTSVSMPVLRLLAT